MASADTDLFLDGVAERALDARRRIEAAVDLGELPLWVMEACERWERAALAYGAALARRDLARVAVQLSPSEAVH